MQYRTHEAAKLCNVTVNTVRNWCKDYGEFLSPSASGSSGNRLFNGRDLDVLKYIAELRSENMQKPAILQRLGETTFAEIDETEQDDQPQALAALPDGQHTTPAPIVAQDYVLSVERRLEALERSKEPSFILGIGLGAIGMGILFLLLIGLALLYSHY